MVKAAEAMTRSAASSGLPFTQLFKEEEKRERRYHMLFLGPESTKVQRKAAK